MTRPGIRNTWTWRASCRPGGGWWAAGSGPAGLGRGGGVVRGRRSVGPHQPVLPAPGVSVGAWEGRDVRDRLHEKRGQTCTHTRATHAADGPPYLESLSCWRRKTNRTEVRTGIAEDGPSTLCRPAPAGHTARRRRRGPREQGPRSSPRSAPGLPETGRRLPERGGKLEQSLPAPAHREPCLPVPHPPAGRGGRDGQSPADSALGPQKKGLRCQRGVDTGQGSPDRTASSLHV